MKKTKPSLAAQLLIAASCTRTGRSSSTQPNESNPPAGAAYVGSIDRARVEVCCTVEALARQYNDTFHLETIERKFATSVALSADAFKFYYHKERQGITAESLRACSLVVLAAINSDNRALWVKTAVNILTGLYKLTKPSRSLEDWAESLAQTYFDGCGPGDYTAQEAIDEDLSYAD